MKKSIFEQIGGTYHIQGDYLLPNLATPEEDKCPIGIWGQCHLQYIREYKKGIYTGLQLSGRLNSCLVEVDRQAGEMFSQLVKQMTERESVMEQMLRLIYHSFSI